MKVVKTNRTHEYGSYRSMSVEGMEEPYIHFDENGCAELEDSVADLIVAEGVGIDYADEADKAPVEESNDAPEVSAPESDESPAEESSDAPEASEDAPEEGENEDAEEDAPEEDAEEAKRAELAELSVDELRELLIEGKVNGNKFSRTKDPKKLIDLIIKEDIL